MATYKNGVTYSGTFAGISVTFTLVNFTNKTVDNFNRLLAEKALEHLKKEEKTV